MTDLEMTRLCAEAMEIDLPINFEGNKDCWSYDPLHDDAQAMALVKKIPLTITNHVLDSDGFWGVESIEIIKGRCPHVMDKDLNRAIVECVAKMWSYEKC